MQASAAAKRPIGLCLGFGIAVSPVDSLSWTGELIGNDNLRHLCGQSGQTPKNTRAAK